MFRESFIALTLLVCTVAVANAAGPNAGGDPAKGAQVFKRCAICHTTDRGGANSIGPNLFGVSGAKAASHSGFSYSPALKNSGLIWTQANLIKWVASPARAVPGNKMSFAGVTSKRQQADVVAYLQSLK